MTSTDELKILDEKIKANQAQYDLGREAAKTSSLSSKDLLEKYEYLTGEDLSDQVCWKKLNLSILLWVCHLVNHLKMLKILRRETVTKFYRFCKVYDEFEEMSLDSKYNSRRVTRGERGGDLPCPFSKIGKKCPDLWKKMP